jgi:rifampicin phosphotransferase
MKNRISTLDRLDCRTHGGKAAALSELVSAGFRVPDFVVSPTDLAATITRLGTPLVVRSSASVEDGQEVSFAGQFTSYLNLRSLRDVESAIRKCMESVKAPSVVEYFHKNGIDSTSVRMHCIVQRMIQPELAGVVFTLNPMTGSEEITLEACAGLADELLAGQQTALDAGHPLLQKYWPKIAALARQIQLHFGMPQDIEFAVADGVVYVLQSRPITAIGFGHDIGEWTNADFRDGGVSSGVCTPLMWSLYDFIWEGTLKTALREIRVMGDDFQAGRMFFGRPYWNLGAVKSCLAKIPGFVERDFDADLSVRKVYTSDGIRTPVTWYSLLRALPTLIAIGALLKKQEQAAGKMLTGDFGAIERKYEQFQGDADTQFRELVEQDYYALESQYFRTIFAASLAKMDFNSAFPNSDYSSLMAALPELRHLAPLRELKRMAAGKNQDISSLLHKYRHHSRLGLDIRFARWDEDQEFMNELLSQLPESHGADPRPGYLQARQAALSLLPASKRNCFERKLDRLRNLVWLREELRDLSSRMYYLIRRQVLKIAEQRGLGDDIFFMSFREIFADERSNIDRNRALYDSYRNFKAPNEIGADFAFDQRPRCDALQGIGASPGTFRGTARVVYNMEQAMHVEKDAILVCPFTEPGWIPVLDRVAGVVTETGGLLSHAAVICREYGIPAVLGVAAATDLIADGRTIVVHGSKGCVDLE